MARYIDADALVKKLSTEPNEPYTEYDEAWDDVIKEINNAPTADVVPAVHGEWTPESAYFVCSLYGNSYDMDEDNPCNYCPNCGAKMDLGAEDDND